MTILALQGITMRFGGIVAIENLSLDVEERTIHAMIGPNGAGKTTVFNCISGVVRPQSGSIRFKKEELTRRGMADIARLGLARTFQHVELFDELTVLENVMVGASARHADRSLTSEHLLAERAVGAMREIGVDLPLAARPGSLSYGDRKMIELARALLADPALLLLDEPTAGLQEEEITRFTETLRRLRDTHGITFLLIAHHMDFVMNVSDTISVMQFGRKIAEGTPGTIRSDAAVRAAYFGSDPVA